MNVVLQGQFSNRQDFFNQLATATWHNQFPDRPTPTNLDGLADLLRETRMQSVSVKGSWRIDPDTTEDIATVFYDLNIGLELPA